MRAIRIHREAVLAVAMLMAAAVLPVAAQPEPAVAPIADTVAPVPTVVRQSTPIPNDPVEAPRPKRKLPKPAESITPEPPADVAEAGKPPSHRCFVRDVMAFYDRTHVRCYNKAKGRFSYFAVDTGQPVAETLLGKAWKSMRSGKPLTITYAPTPDLNPTNCEPRDCRRLIDVLN